MMADFGVEVEAFTHTAPPGEEAFDLSHAGGEHEAFEGLTHQLADLTGHHHIDPRSRGEWTETQTTHWNLQMDRLVDVYLDYRCRDSGDDMPDMSDQNMSGVNASFSINDIKLIDNFTRRHTHLQPLLSHHYPNETLIYYGYIGCAPMYPSVAISLRTLATYHQSH
ncbi:hypothetical protein DEU56DRAFT_722950 [Suillus clintonianus]|uniref:uncharacterized protein n=1 Tax=Suillus clintonianus TaxID=1904413 RepID=UPI001B8861EA|nr:uncharacterized protein DEU56DRAFT_722950 [Suillus clintonianus]KAG2157313.1 hypothetical protein DEU56DRAFT_722950 [Suillus clintonianus]